MNHIIVAEEHQLRAIVHEEVSKLFHARHEPKTEIDTMTLSAALALLADYGYILSKAKLYKLTASGNIPCRKFGQKFFLTEKLNRVDYFKKTTIFVPEICTYCSTKTFFI